MAVRLERPLGVAGNSAARRTRTAGVRRRDEGERASSASTLMPGMQRLRPSFVRRPACERTRPAPSVVVTRLEGGGRKSQQGDVRPGREAASSVWRTCEPRRRRRGRRPLRSACHRRLEGDPEGSHLVYPESLAGSHLDRRASATESAPSTGRRSAGPGLAPAESGGSCALPVPDATQDLAQRADRADCWSVLEARSTLRAESAGAPGRPRSRRQLRRLGESLLESRSKQRRGRSGSPESGSRVDDEDVGERVESRSDRDRG